MTINYLDMSTEQIKDYAVIIGVAITLLTLIIGVLEFRRQGKIKRVEKFLEMRRRFKENSDFKNIFELLENDDAELENISWELKLQFLGFFEEVALLVNSKIIKKRIAHYMFGYYAIKCWESDYFCSDVNRKSHYWSVMNNFVIKMQKIQDSFFFRFTSLRLFSKRYKI